MDYKAMTAKLVAVRKEIRKNVWHLNMADKMEADFNKKWEDMIWAGETSYAYYRRTMTKEKFYQEYPLEVKDVFLPTRKSFFFCSHKSDGYFWFRVFGVGIHFKNVNKHPLLFSERNGYTKYLKLGKYIITYLPKWNKKDN